MPDLTAVELKPFVPARDYEHSKRFYADFGFRLASDAGGTAYFHHGNVAFLLMDFYEQQLAEHLTLHLLVKDVDAWYAAVTSAGLAEQYGSTITPIEQQPWRMRDFTITDPAGVTWRIAQNTD